ncbi:MAG: FtsQ-type POTRA domain-containing protein [Arthrobacter sp.]|nr:FtsQ-type POTRA domain-containing protein [Arthrobacter sp.]
MSESSQRGSEHGTGAVLQMPRPARRRRLRGWIAAAAAVLVVGGLLALLYLTPLLSVRTISISGTRLADEAKVRTLLQGFVGMPLARVSSEGVREALASEPAISDIRLGLDGPSGLEVTVLEHREVAVMAAGDGYVLVGDNGAKLKTLSKRSDRKLPLVKLEAKDADGRIFDTVVHALSQLPASVLKQLETAEAASVDTVTFSLGDGRTVVWGDASEGSLKAKVLAAMLKDKDLTDKVIDVSTPRTPLSK